MTDSNPDTVDLCIERRVWMSNAWYMENCIIVNLDKHHTMGLGSTDHQFSFTTKDLVDHSGMTINK